MKWCVSGGNMLCCCSPRLWNQTPKNTSNQRKKNHIHQNQNQSDCVIEALSAALPFNNRSNINISFWKHLKLTAPKWSNNVTKYETQERMSIIYRLIYIDKSGIWSGGQHLSGSLGFFFAFLSCSFFLFLSLPISQYCLCFCAAQPIYLCLDYNK